MLQYQPIDFGSPSQNQGPKRIHLGSWETESNASAPWAVLFCCCTKHAFSIEPLKKRSIVFTAASEVCIPEGNNNYQPDDFCEINPKKYNP
jgi:hypothetical protein